MASNERGSSEFARRLEKRLSDLSTRADSIQALSQYAMHHKSDHTLFVQTWERQLRSVGDPEKRLALFYACNDIVQNCKRHGAEVYLKSFESALHSVMPVINKDSNSVPKVERIFKIWQERRVYPQVVTEGLLQNLMGKRTSSSTVVSSASTSSGNDKFRHETHDHHTAPSVLGVSDAASTFSVSDILSKFKSESLIEKIRTQAVIDSEIAIRKETMKNLDFDASDAQVISHLKNKSEGKEFCDKFERSYTTLQAFVALLEKQTEGRRKLIETLENAEVFYDSQYAEVKKIEPVYKKFLNNVNTVVKKTNERMDALPSPTYDEEAPTPSTNDGSEAMDIETTDSSLLDDIARIGSTIFNSGVVSLDGSISVSASVFEHNHSRAPEGFANAMNKMSSYGNGNGNGNANHPPPPPPQMPPIPPPPPPPPHFSSFPPPAQPPPLFQTPSNGPPQMFGSPPPQHFQQHQQYSQNPSGVKSSPNQHQGPSPLLSPRRESAGGNIPSPFSSPPPFFNQPPPNFSNYPPPPHPVHSPSQFNRAISPRGSDKRPQMPPNSFNFPPPQSPGQLSLNQIPTVINRNSAMQPGIRSPTSPTAIQSLRPLIGPPGGGLMRKRSLEPQNDYDAGGDGGFQQQHSTRPGMASAEHLVPAQPVMLTSMGQPFGGEPMRPDGGSSRPISTIVGVRRSSSGGGGGGMDPRLHQSAGGRGYRGRGRGGFGNTIF